MNTPFSWTSVLQRRLTIRGASRVGEASEHPHIWRPKFASDAAPRRLQISTRGCVAYQLIAGRWPYDDALDPREAHIEETPVPLGDVVPDVPERLARAIARSLAKIPKDRH